MSWLGEGDGEGKGDEGDERDDEDGKVDEDVWGGMPPEDQSEDCLQANIWIPVGEVPDRGMLCPPYFAILC